MGQRIEKYTEVEYSFGEDRPNPTPGEMQVLVNRVTNEVEAVDFLCPCGCGRNVYTPVVCSKRQRPRREPVWDYHMAGHLIHPSVNWTGGCMSHFFINLDGTVKWC